MREHRLAKLEREALLTPLPPPMALFPPHGQARVVVPESPYAYPMGGQKTLLSAAKRKVAYQGMEHRCTQGQAGIAPRVGHEGQGCHGPEAHHSGHRPALHAWHCPLIPPYVRPRPMPTTCCASKLRRRPGTPWRGPTLPALHTMQ